MCIGYLELNQFESITKNKSEWIAFLLFNIWTTFAPQVFIANLLEFYQKLLQVVKGIGI
jgi:hypothetical protein